MQTSLRCAKNANVLLFSDMEQNIGPYHLHDALKDTAPEVKRKDSIFDYYRKQQDVWRENGTVGISTLKGMRDPQNNKDLAAWTLDKYKNIHILERTWELVPDKEWYLLIDADTYIIWSNLLRWLPMLDPSERAYFGSRVFLSNVAFAHGGSGTLFPRSLMYDLAITHKGTATRWDPEIHTTCCGDYMLGRALGEYGNELVSVPLTHSEFFVQIVKDQLQNMTTIVDDWDNWSSITDFGSGRKGDEKVAAGSAEECIAACEAYPGCFQFVHDGENCHLGKAIRPGERKNPEGAQRWRSGWHQKRIAEWAASQKACSDVTFPDWRKRRD
ncbi:hypothetical protein AA313_de0209853 [Arthrobotrys entomopaga]|nr:hypothetical protein AA313_de0209853 [Arthrobotrys entomopaga]